MLVEIAYDGPRRREAIGKTANRDMVFAEALKVDARAARAAP